MKPNMDIIFFILIIIVSSLAICTTLLLSYKGPIITKQTLNFMNTVYNNDNSMFRVRVYQANWLIDQFGQLDVVPNSNLSGLRFWEIWIGYNIEFSQIWLLGRLQIKVNQKSTFINQRDLSTIIVIWLLLTPITANFHV